MRPFRPFKIPSDIQITRSNNYGEYVFSNGKSFISSSIGNGVEISVKDSMIDITLQNPSEVAKLGTAKAVIKKNISLLLNPKVVKLSLNGVGYKFSIVGKMLFLFLGHSHNICLEIPEGLSVKQDADKISIEGIDDVLLGDFANIIRSLRKPEPYKGKGVYINNEKIIRKVGKVSK